MFLEGRWFCGAAPLPRQRSSGEVDSVRATAGAADLATSAVPPRTHQGSRRRWARRHHHGLPPAAAARIM